MEILQEILRDSVSGGFLHFCGYYILLFLVTVVPSMTIFVIINRIIRGININKHGFPPPHCDGDGDFKEEKDEQDNT